MFNSCTTPHFWYTHSVSLLHFCFSLMTPTCTHLQHWPAPVLQPFEYSHSICRQVLERLHQGSLKEITSLVDLLKETWPDQLRQRETQMQFDQLTLSEESFDSNHQMVLKLLSKPIRPRQKDYLFLISCPLLENSPHVNVINLVVSMWLAL